MSLIEHPCPKPIQESAKIASTMLINDGITSLAVLNAIDLSIQAKNLHDFSKRLGTKLKLEPASTDISLATIFSEMVALEAMMFKALLDFGSPAGNEALQKISDKATLLRTKYCYRCLSPGAASMGVFADDFFSFGYRLGSVADNVTRLPAIAASRIGYTPQMAAQVYETLKGSIEDTISMFTSENIGDVIKEGGIELITNILTANLGTAINAVAFCRLMDPLIGITVDIYGAGSGTIAYAQSIFGGFASIYNQIKGLYQKFMEMTKSGVSVATISSIALGISAGMPAIQRALKGFLGSMSKVANPEVLLRISNIAQTLDKPRRERLLAGDLQVLTGTTNLALQIEEVKGKIKECDARLNPLIYIKPRTDSEAIISRLVTQRAKYAELLSFLEARRMAENKTAESDGFYDYGQYMLDRACLEKQQAIEKEIASMAEEGNQL